MIISPNKSKFKTMKIFKNLTLFLAVVSMASIFAGCNKDEDDPIITPATVITVTSPVDGASAISGTTINLAFTANSDNGLKRVVVKFKSATGTETTKFDTALTSQPTGFTFSRSYTVGNIGNETYTIVVTDKKDNIESKSINIKSITGFAEEGFGKFYHILGTNPGAFDLSKGEQRVISDADNDKDMVNTDGAGIFTGAWESKNNTMFVKTNTFDYSSGTINDAKYAYSLGTPNTKVLAPINGSVYIAKLRGTENYAIVKVIADEPTNDECGCSNKGKLTFNFKKML